MLPAREYPLFDAAAADALGIAFGPERGELLRGNPITLEDGTGLVHTAPGHGTEDYQTGLREGFEIYCPVQGDGTFDDSVPGWLQGLDVWSANPKIQILGNPGARRLSIVSFLVRHGDRYLHHNFVVALLNDLFGIQSRGGCSCAGPYGHRLLGIGRAESDAILAALERGEETAKPGWVRLNLSALMTDAKADVIVQAVDDLARVAPDHEFRYRVDAGTARYSAVSDHEESAA